MKYRFGVASITVAVVAVMTGLLLMGSGQSGSTQKVYLKAWSGGEFARAELVASRRSLFGVDPLEKDVALDAQFRFTPKVTSERVNENIIVTGGLLAGAERIPLRLSGDMETIKNAQGHEFHSGVALGSIKIHGQDVFVTMFVSTIPDENKYVATISLQPASGTVAVFAFGSTFTEYSAKFQVSSPAQAKEGK